MRYFLGFSYQGTSYHGWQIQPNAITVQEVLEDRMSKLLGNETKLVGAGRTDAGVHAKSMVAHFDSEIEDIDKFIYRLNSFLPQDIAVHSLQKMKPEAHARFDATERTYHYYINYQKDPFKTDLSWHWNYEVLDINKMNQAADLLLKYDDFTSFARLHTDNKTNICDVRYAVWSEESGNLKFEITADRFLRNMVRSVVGTLVEVGKGKTSLEEFIDIIEKKDRKFAAASAPAHGLFLTHVAYPKDLYL
ncbi:tRNA pseudouridine(38-40) synthase TruA [Weeksellaceae bacterium KMM 9724]|uniref:tRNA pseudouridine(38-40) synthase TruA n=1 Tax=Profundicola chukchiensis TaxID=2961959 RepID=UPI002439F2E7|nr:tRNA pseudouridine(38-40) synthase TruA [Profundicola chukchiensis]MDG4950646.1 tRNA pseudouridine(38-40) synthase TruA [Profundicola chukchiensis]